MFAGYLCYVPIHSPSPFSSPSPLRFSPSSSPPSAVPHCSSWQRCQSVLRREFTLAQSVDGRNQNGKGTYVCPLTPLASCSTNIHTYVHSSNTLLQYVVWKQCSCHRSMEVNCMLVPLHEMAYTCCTNVAMYVRI